MVAAGASDVDAARSVEGAAEAVPSPAVAVAVEAEEEEAEEDEEVKQALGVLRSALVLLASELARWPSPRTLFCPLPRDVPIRSLHLAGFHGKCDCHVQQNELHDDGVRRAAGLVVHSIGVQLHDRRGSLLPVELLLATFIHELAHTVTRPEMRRCREVPGDVLKLQPQVREVDPNDFAPVHHPESFYANFGLLLRAAEQLGIYVLPPMPNKFGRKALMRFDNLDPEACLCGLNLGRSPCFATALGAMPKPLQVLLTDARRSKQKPLTLEPRHIDEVLSQAKHRLNLRRRPTAVANAAGRPLGDADLQGLEDGALLVAT